MLALFLFIVFGVLFGYFATLNTMLVTIHFGTYTLSNIALYLVVLASLGIGVLFATLFYLVKTLSAKFVFHKKEGELMSAQREIAELTKKNHRLEIENTRLKTKAGEELADEDEDSL